MENRLFEDHTTTTLENISEYVNHTFDEDFDYYDRMECIKKWNSFPILFLEKKEIREKVLKVIFYLDELEFDKKEKVSFITTLAAMVELGKFKILDYEESEILPLISYLDSVTVDSFDEEMNLLSRKDLLLAVRKKTLDLIERKFVLSYIDSLSIEFMNDPDDKKEMDTFVSQMIAFLQQIEYYELLEVSGFSAYQEVRTEEEQEPEEEGK